MTATFSTVDGVAEGSSTLYFCEVQGNGDFASCRFDFLGESLLAEVQVYDLLRVRLMPLGFETTVMLQPMPER